MPSLTGPLVYLSDSAPASLAAFSEVARFAEAIGTRALLATVQAEAAASAANAPDAITLSRHQLAADLMAVPDVAHGAVALMSQPASGVRRLLTSSLNERLLRETPLPLFVLPADGKIGVIRRILFPADLSPRSLPAFDQVIALCRDLNAELDVLHVYGEDRLLPSEMDLDRRLAAQSPRELFNIHKESIAALIDRAQAAGVQTASKSAEGRAHTHILAYTSNNPIDLIVMPTHGLRTVEDRMYGTTTARVLQQAPVPVLVLRA